jgi:hypothetical protein
MLFKFAFIHRSIAQLNEETEMKKAKLTQAQRILKHLASGKKLTPTYAKKYMAITKPSARVCELRDEGFNIVSGKNRVGAFAWSL